MDPLGATGPGSGGIVSLSFVTSNRPEFRTPYVVAKPLPPPEAAAPHEHEQHAVVIPRRPQQATKDNMG
ncbi:hypothetical protein QQP08_010123 [Theobroma cacao]|nr:hypothetical protein QQP08_010123 [Theobroma cacao]